MASTHATFDGGGTEPDCVLEGFSFSRVLFQSKNTAVLEWEMDLGEGQYTPIAVKISADKRRLNREFMFARQCAGLETDNDSSTPSHREEWSRAVEAAREKRIIAPFAHCELPSGQLALLSPKMGDALECRSPASPLQTVQIVRDVAVGLGHCHAENCIHLDVKPANIIVDEEGRAYLIDFSLTRVRLRNGISSRSGLGGTRAYMAPEQTGRLAVPISFVADLYSLGVAMYEFVAGGLPFPRSQHGTAVEMIHAQVAKSPPPLSEDIPAVLRLIINKLMCKDTAQRYSSARSLVDDLDRLLADGFEAPGFVLDPNPTSMALRPLDGRLFGCDSQIGEVTNALRLLPHQLTKSRLVSIAGPAGAGKSSLMRHIALQRGLGALLCSGKYLQYERAPYRAVSECFQSLASQLRALSPSRLRRLSGHITGHPALLAHAKQLAAIAPEFYNFVKQVGGASGATSSDSRLFCDATLPPPTAAGEDCARYTEAFVQVFRFFYDVASLPVVLFVDDLQWADDCSLRLIQSLLVNESTSVLLLCCYRNKEVGPTDPLGATWNRLKEASDRVEMTEVLLHPWSRSVVEEVLAFMLDTDGDLYSKDELKILASRVTRSTGGNPFFTIEFVYSLVKDKLLRYSWNARRWTWNVAELNSDRFCDNVVAVIANSMEQLPADTRLALAALATAGLPCPLGMLKDCLPLSARGNEHGELSGAIDHSFSLADSDQAPVLPALRPALDLGMVLLEGPAHDKETIVRFSHDEIERSCKELVGESHCLRLEIAAAIARWLGLPVLSSLGELWKESEDWVIRDHQGLPTPHQLCFLMLNLFVEEQGHLVDNRAALQLLAALTAEAASVAVSTLAYVHGVQLYKSSVSFEDTLLQRNEVWYDCERSSKLWSLRKDLGAALVLSQIRTEARQVLLECCAHAKSDMQKLEALHLLAKLTREMESYDEAIDYGIESAALMGVEVNKNVTFDEVFATIRELVLVPLEAVSGSLKDLLPGICEDPSTCLCDDVLDNMVPSAFCAGKIALHALIPAITLGRAIKRGSCTTGTFALITVMGFNLCGIFRLRKEGWTLALQGLRLYEQYLQAYDCTPDPRIYVGAALAHPWGGIPRDCYQWLDTAFSYAHKLGNFGYCGYTRTISLWAHVMYGINLGEILRLYNDRIHFVANCGLTDLATSMKGVAFACRLLIGGNVRPTPEELANLEFESQDRCAFAKLSCTTWIALAYQVLGRSLDAKRLYGKVTEDWKEGASGMAPQLDFFWVEGLLCASWLRSSRSTTSRQAIQWMAALERALKELKSMATDCSSNWRAKYLLVKAHYLSVLSLDPNENVSPLRALQVFERAANEGDVTNMTHIAALACLGASECCTSALGLGMAKSGYVNAASNRFEAWGARQVAADLGSASGLRQLRNYSVPMASLRASSSGRVSVTGNLVSPPSATATPEPSERTNSAEFEGTIESEAIARASSVISSKISIREVILAFVDIIEQTAGAQKIVLLLKEPKDRSKPSPALLASWADLLEPSATEADAATGRRRSDPATHPAVHAAIQRDLLSSSAPVLSTKGGSQSGFSHTNAALRGLGQRSRAVSAAPSKMPEPRQAGRSASTVEVERLCDDFHVEALKNDGVLSIGASPLNGDVAPLQLLMKSRSVGSPVIITDALGNVEAAGADSAYFCLHKVRSALAVPVPYQDKVHGMIYLENNKAAGVFHSKTAGVVSMLCAQLGISVQNARLYEHLKERQLALEETNRSIAAAHAASTRFVPEPFLRRVGRANTMEVCLGDAVETKLTILFADLRSFTSVSEKMDAKSVFRFLNRLLAVVVPAIAQNGGSVDKFLGDGTLSLFSEAANALSAARAIQVAVRELNLRNDSDRFGNPWPQVKLGVGIHTGYTILGCLGTATRLDATVVGDAVNLASRVESLTKGMAVDILATAATVDAALGEAGACASGKADFAPLLRNMGEVLVEGKERPTLVFQVFEQPSDVAKEEAGQELSAALQSMLDTRMEFYEGLRLHKAGDYHAAEDIFASLFSRCSLDSAARVRASWARQAAGAEVPTSTMRYWKDGTRYS